MIEEFQKLLTFQLGMQNNEKLTVLLGKRLSELLKVLEKSKAYLFLKNYIFVNLSSNFVIQQRLNLKFLSLLEQFGWKISWWSAGVCFDDLRDILMEGSIFRQYNYRKNSYYLLTLEL